jgi:hypothetical protein
MPRLRKFLKNLNNFRVNPLRVLKFPSFSITSHDWMQASSHDGLSISSSKRAVYWILCALWKCYFIYFQWWPLLIKMIYAEHRVQMTLVQAFDWKCSREENRKWIINFTQYKFYAVAVFCWFQNIYNEFEMLQLSERGRYLSGVWCG